MNVPNNLGRISSFLLNYYVLKYLKYHIKNMIFLWGFLVRINVCPVQCWCVCEARLSPTGSQPKQHKILTLSHLSVENIEVKLKILERISNRSVYSDIGSYLSLCVWMTGNKQGKWGRSRRLSLGWIKFKKIVDFEQILHFEGFYNTKNWKAY